MNNFNPEPGDLFYLGNYGISVVTGKKSVSLGEGRQEFWEVRTLDDPRSAISIPENKFSGRARKFLDQAELINILEIFAQTTDYHKLQTRVNAPTEQTIQAAYGSTDPHAISTVVIELLRSRRLTEKAFLNSENEFRRSVQDGMKLLAQDLSMASGLSVSKALLHIQDVIFTKPTPKLWPEEVSGSRLDKLDAESFKEAFGITFEQAQNLNSYPVVITADNSSGTLTTRQVIQMAIESIGEAKPQTARIERRIEISQAFASTKNEYSDLVPAQGKLRAVFNFACSKMSVEQVSLLAPLFFVSPASRKTISDLAKDRELSEESLLAELKSVVAEFADVAREAGRSDYITGAMMNMFPEITENSDNPALKDLIEKENNFVPSVGLNAGLYTLAKQVLEPLSFRVYVPSELRIKQNQLTLEQIAQELGLDVSEVRKIRDQAVVILREELIRQGRTLPNVQYRSLTLLDKSGDTNAEQRQEADITNSSHVAREIQEDALELEGEESIYEHMRLNGFDAHTLFKLGRIYDQKGSYDCALKFYGAARDLDADDEMLIQRISQLESSLGYTYQTERDFSEIEQFLQDKLNVGTGRYTEHGFQYANGHGQEDFSAEGGSGFQGEKTYSDTVNGLTPRITIAIPPEALGEGRRLKITFTNVGSNQTVVMMSVEQSTSLRAAEQGHTSDNIRSVQDADFVDIELN